MPRPARSRPSLSSSAHPPLTRPVAIAVESLESRTLLAAGSPDPTFGGGGRVIFDFPATAFDGARDAVLQSDGKIVVLTEGNGPNAARLARFTAGGVLDDTFGSGGYVLLNHDARAIAVRADNKLVVVGEAGDTSAVVARYTPGGQPDATFGGGDGQVIEQYFGGPTTGDKVIAKVLVQPMTNRIYVAGSADPNGTGLYDFALAAFNDDGTRYAQFGDTDQFTTLTDFGNDERLADAAFAPNGDLVGVGAWTISDSHHPYYLEDYAIARWDEHGVPVRTFSANGRASVGFGNSPVSNPPTFDEDSLFDAAQSVAVDPAGNILVAGRSRDPRDDNPTYTSLARLKPDGTLDSTFGPGGAEGDGRVLLPLTGRGLFADNEVAIEPGTGKILVATAAPGAEDVDFALARLTAAGAPDTSFGPGGKVSTDFAMDDFPTQLLIQNGRALVVGITTNVTSPPGPNSSSLVMARYLLDAAANPQGPFGRTPWPVPGVLEFEDFDEGGEGVAYHDTDAVNQGDAYRNTGVDVQPVPANTADYTLAFARAGEWAEYTVNVTQAGAYDVAVEYASLRGGGRFHLEVDDRVVTPVTTVQSTGDWRNYRTLTLGGINLTAGDHVLRLAMDANDSTGYVANFNRARFTLGTPSPSNQSPFGTRPIGLPGVLSFEDYDRGGEGVAYHDTEPQNLGGAYRGDGADVQVHPSGATVLAFTKAGEWTEYTVDVSQGGVHGVSINYASLRGGGKFHLEVDGVRLTPTFTLPSTGSWEAYRWLHLGQFNLPAGRHVIRLSMDANDSTGYVGNFNHAAFRFIAPVAPAPFKGTPFQPNQQIEAEDFDAGGEGVAYHDAEPQNLGGAYRPSEGVDVQPTGDAGGGGYNVGFTRPGEYLTYTVSTATGGTVGLQMRMAALREGGSGTVEVDGNYVLSFDVPATGGWQTYVTVNTPKDILLAPGVHTLRVRSEFADSTGYVGNFNWLKLVS